MGKCQTTPGTHAKSQYYKCTKELRRKCRELTRRHEENVVLSNNLGTFYKHVNNRISYRSAIGALTGENDTIVTSDGDKANMFNMYYASVGVVDDGTVPPCPSVAVRSTIESIIFDEASVLAAIHKVKSNLSAGPDGLPAVTAITVQTVKI